MNYGHDGLFWLTVWSRTIYPSITIAVSIMLYWLQSMVEHQFEFDAVFRRLAKQSWNLPNDQSHSGSKFVKNLGKFIIFNDKFMFLMLQVLLCCAIYGCSALLPRFMMPNQSIHKISSKCIAFLSQPHHQAYPSPQPKHVFMVWNEFCVQG